MANTIITIGRQFGSGGHEIGKIAARELGIECYDSRLIQMASEKSCIGMEHLKPVDQKAGQSLAVYRAFGLFQ